MMDDAREQAVQALQQAGVRSARDAKDSGMVSVLTGIGYALLYVGDAIKGDRDKYEPPF